MLLFICQLCDEKPKAELLHICIAIKSLNKDVLMTEIVSVSLIPRGQRWPKVKEQLQQASYGTHTQLRNQLSPHRHLCVRETEASAVTEISVSLSRFYIHTSLSLNCCNLIGNSSRSEWQSRLRSLLYCWAASSSCSSALAQDLPVFLSRHIVQHHCFPSRNPTAAPVPQCDQGFFGIGCCITTRSGRCCAGVSSKRWSSGNFRAAHWLSSTQAAFASCMWPSRWRNAESLHLRQSAAKCSNFDTKRAGMQKADEK